MRLIPGNTKVQIELFKGVSLWDLFVGAIDIVILALIVTSSFPYKLVAIVVHLVFAALLLSRMDNEPNYMYLVHIIRHFGFKRKFLRTEKDKDIVAPSEDGNDENSAEEEIQESVHAETKKERKERLKAEKEERKRDDKLLKSKKLSKEEEDAIWLKRANQSAARKQSKHTKKAKANSASGSEFKGKKWAKMEGLSSFTDIKDGYINFHKKYYGAALEIPAVEFRFFSQYRKNNAIENGFGPILRSLKADYSFNILKIERPISYENYEELEFAKLESLKKSYENGFMKEDELKTRVAIVYDRINEIQRLIKSCKVIVPFYYLIFFDSDKRQLDLQVTRAQESLRTGEMESKRLNDKELALMLKYSNSLDFEENDLDRVAPENYAKWAMPESVQFFPRISVVDGIATHNFRVTKFPSSVPDAWLASLMTYPSTKVMLKVKPMDSAKAIRAIDRSLSELRATAMTAKTDSARNEAQAHIETLQMLLNSMQNSNESLLNVNVYVTAYDFVYTANNANLVTPPKGSFRNRIAEMKKTVKREWAEAGLRLNNNEFNQAIAYIGSQVSAYDPMESMGRGMPSNTVAATFPWVFPHLMDKNGVQLGTSGGVPVFVDFFVRNSERVNSNMVVIGKSGSGKSFATKTILSNLAADDAKIFILDPEDEYTDLAANLHGKFINVATNQYGRLNPFNIITSLDDDTEGVASTGYSSHLQFLEEFFKQILPDCDKDSLEYLNTLIDRIYKKRGIDSETDLSLLKPEDYPIFDDLYDEILMEFQKTSNEYIRTMLRTLMNYVSKFSEGGRNAVIWDGPSSITTEENFIVFNFQSLLANRNSTIANAQMLLVLKYIDNEISKNRDYNEKYGLNRKIVVVIDEAHVFIDEKYPVALDFMFQLAKRIRKYNGMQIVITQNIKDFVGSEEIARKSTAIINASQYSFIFALSPNDMQDLCKLYEKAGGINENEQEQIVQAPRGQSFTVMSPVSRSFFKIVAPEDTRKMFSGSKYTNPYFSGEQGEEYWEEFIGDSRSVRDANVSSRKRETVSEDIDTALERLNIKFSEISEEDYYAEIHEEETKKTGGINFSEEQGLGGISFSEESGFGGINFTEESGAGSINFTEEPASSGINFSEISSDTAAQYVPVNSVNAARKEPAAVQPVIIQQSSKTEELLAQLIEKFSTESMMYEIKKAVKEEVAGSIPEGMVSQSASASTASPDYEDDDDDFEIDDILGSLSIPDESDSKSSSSASLGSIFDFADLGDEDEDESEESDDEDQAGSFDIISLLSDALDEESASDMFIDDFINGTETLAVVTLEQLASYNRRQFIN